jgi:hypothetical protein
MPALLLLIALPTSLTTLVKTLKQEETQSSCKKALSATAYFPTHCTGACLYVLHQQCMKHCRPSALLHTQLHRTLACNDVRTASTTHCGMQTVIGSQPPFLFDKKW